ncbi:MAG: hypothetical protein AMS17_15115 [Spirochaetes bacterium DG_61]|jgi:NAD(P)-dependent dehydrogenase (short-subunit alcohol dehydrogenase family)|nr:MAG: hypothetical protein AMS17_15115 [Spirochaetes bacterium DG_61]
MNKVQGKVAIVTGAGRGLGAHVAHSLGEKGAHVVTFDREIVAKAESSDAIVIKGDVTSESDVESCIKVTKDKLGTPQILVTCAGIFGPSAIVQYINRSEWENVLRVNLTGTFLFVKKVLPLMLEHGWGRIVCFASTAGVANPPGNAPYNVSKAGVISLMHTVSQEIDIENVCINAICPGNTDTPMTQSIERSASTGKTGDRVAYHRQLREKGLYHQPEDIMDLITFLTSEESQYINGQFIQLTATRMRG